MGKYQSLKEQYPEQISLDQLYRICRISKRSASYLIQHGIIPAVDTGRKTWRYKIALNDMITYLLRREKLGSMIPAGAVSSRPNCKRIIHKTFAQMIEPGQEPIVVEYLAFVYAEYADVLTTDDVSEMTGLNKSAIQKRLS